MSSRDTPAKDDIYECIKQLPEPLSPGDLASIVSQSMSFLEDHEYENAFKAEEERVHAIIDSLPLEQAQQVIEKRRVAKKELEDKISKIATNHSKRAALIEKMKALEMPDADDVDGLQQIFQTAYKKWKRGSKAKK
jgi:hypothetical protein